MGQIQSVDRVKQYVPALEGIRGYGFLLVFCGHYFMSDLIAHPGTMRFKLLTTFGSLALFGVPAFFVLSGYLIGGILYGTRNREGYFRVFYTRRILRVFPVYYITLLVIAGFYALHGVRINHQFWISFLYIQNLFPSYSSVSIGPVYVGHFWSLAVEEQFYLLWPLVVWLFPEKRKLLKVSLGLIACCCVVRFLMPFLMADPRMILFFTPARADAILLGVVLALIRRDAIYDKIEPFAKWAVLAGVVGVTSLVMVGGRAWGKSVVGREVLVPLVNITAFAIVIAVMEENSWMNRVCSQRWACWIGSLSYSLYVFHYTFAPYFYDVVTPWLAMHMRSSFAALTAGLLAFGLTLVLSLISYRFIEGPVMKLKGYMKYGAKQSEMPMRMPTAVLARTGT